MNGVVPFPTTTAATLTAAISFVVGTVATRRVAARQAGFDARPRGVCTFVGRRTSGYATSIVWTAAPLLIGALGLAGVGGLGGLLSVASLPGVAGFITDAVLVGLGITAAVAVVLLPLPIAVVSLGVRDGLAAASRVWGWVLARPLLTAACFAVFLACGTAVFAAVEALEAIVIALAGPIPSTPALLLETALAEAVAWSAVTRTALTLRDDEDGIAPDEVAA